MNPTARAVMLGNMGLLLATLFAAGALTNQPPLLATPPLVDAPTNLYFKPLGSAPMIRLGGKPGPSQPLEPGVYQTRPYAIILVVPKAGLDDHCVAGASNTDSKMPIFKPGLRAVPIVPSK
jgi:hypothetical protein